MHSNRHQIAEAIKIVYDLSWLDDNKLYVVKLVGWLVDIIGQNPLHPQKSLRITESVRHTSD